MNKKTVKRVREQIDTELALTADLLAVAQRAGASRRMANGVPRLLLRDHADGE